ncbi:MAG: enoyl-CoA hydratase/isomerase family protein [Chloroflexota bacterium]
MNFQALTVSIEGKIGYLTLNRPDRLNALGPTLLRELAEAAAWFNQQLNVQVVIIRGEGRAFSVGADLKEPTVLTGPDATLKPEDMAGLDEAAQWVKRREMAQLGYRMSEAISNMRALTIAQVQGYAIGGGLVLMASCDFRLVAEGTAFIIPEVDLGIPLAWGGIPVLVRELGPLRTKELVITCRRFTPEEALGWGFINQVLTLDELPAAVNELGELLASKPSVPTFITKEHVNAAASEMASGGNIFADGDTLLGVTSDPAFRDVLDAYVARTVKR